MHGQLVKIERDFCNNIDNIDNLTISVVDAYTDIDDALTQVKREEHDGLGGREESDVKQTGKLIDAMAWSEGQNIDGHYVMNSVCFGGLMEAEDEFGLEWRFIPISINVKGMEKATVTGMIA